MYDDIRNAHAELREALLGFNAQWPGQVVSGGAWRLPLLREQKASDVISVERLTGNDAIQSAKAAFSMLERASGQSTFVFAECCVFIKQSQPPIFCNPF